MSNDPNHNDDSWFDFLDPRYQGPKFEDEPRRVRRKKRRAWDRQQRAEKAAALSASVRAQRQEDPIPPQTIFAAMIIIALMLAAAVWLVPKFLGRDSDEDAAPVATASHSEVTPTPTPTDTHTPADNAISASTPEDLMKKWVTAYFTRTTASDSDWVTAVTDVTKTELMNELENGWPPDSVFTDCPNTAVDKLEFVDAPPDSPPDTSTRKTAVANVIATCGDERKQVPLLIEAAISEGTWKISRAIEMETEVLE